METIFTSNLQNLNIECDEIRNKEKKLTKHVNTKEFIWGLLILDLIEHTKTIVNKKKRKDLRINVFFKYITIIRTFLWNKFTENVMYITI